MSESTSFASDCCEPQDNFEDPSLPKNVVLLSGEEPLYKGGTAQVTQQESTKLIRKFLIDANLNDTQKVQFYNLMKRHLPVNTKLNDDWLPSKMPPFIVNHTTEDNFILFDVNEQYQSIVKGLHIQRNPAIILFLDGATKYVKGGDSFWPLLGHLLPANLDEHFKFTSQQNVMVIGLSKKLPKVTKPSYKFIEKCCDSVKDAGIEIYNVTCDLPARAFALNHSNFNGEYGCFYCTAASIRKNGRTLYPNCHCSGKPRKTEEVFASAQCGVKGPSPFKFVKCPRDFRIDVMHLFGAGLCKRQMNLLLRGSELKNHAHQLSSSAKRTLQASLEETKLPRNIPLSRTDMSLKYQWKAKTCIYFFLHFIPLLKPFLSHDKFESLLLLSNIIFLFGNEVQLCNDSLVNIELLCDSFCSSYENIWGPNECTITFHHVRHLLEQCSEDGGLSPFCYSAFPFESYLHTLMKSMHGTIGSLSQSARNITLRIQHNANQRENSDLKRSNIRFTHASKDTEFRCNSLGFCYRTGTFFKVKSVGSNTVMGQPLKTEPLLQNSLFCNNQKIVQELSVSCIYEKESCCSAVRVEKYISPVIIFTLM